MIKCIRHKGLERFFLYGETKGIQARHGDKLRLLLTALNMASLPDHLRLLSGTKLHALKGNRQGQWSMWVTGNWRLVFEFEDGDVTNVDLMDYH